MEKVCGGVYLFYGGLNLIYNIAVRIFNHTTISSEEIIGTLLLTKHSIINELWFLPALLFSEILVMYIWYFMRSINRTMFCLAVVAAAGVWINAVVNVKLPLNQLYCVPMASLCIGFGIELRQWDARRVNSLNSMRIIILTGSMLIAGNWINLKILHSPEVAFWRASYGNILMFFVNAISGIQLVVGISRKISNCRLLQRIGQRTMEIYGCHYIILSIGIKIANRLQLQNLFLSSIILLVLSFIIAYSITRVSEFAAFSRK